MHCNIMPQTELLKGNLQTIILKLLADHGKMYGYEITQKVKDLSEGTMVLTEGALYPTLHKLESDGWVETEVTSMGKRIRKYYKLTRSGQSVMKERVDDFLEFIITMGRVLQLKIQDAG